MMEQGLLHLYWGDGKGKTTAAMGLALRALGSGKRVVIVQFLKGGQSGEIPLLAQLGAKIFRGKGGQKFVFQMNEAEKAAARAVQNENLTATVEGEILATTPDLICLVDTDTFQPVPTDALKYGKRVMVVGLKCFPLWRTQAGLDLVGPRYFGVDTDYIPLEERCKGRRA